MNFAVDEATGMIAGPGPAHAAPQDGTAATPSAPPEDRKDTTVETPGAATNGPTPAPAPAEQPTTGADPATVPQSGAVSTPGFRERGRMRRRLAFLRRARELAYRDLGGLVFNLHRFGQRHDELVLAKLSVLERLDGEQQALEAALAERRAVTVLRVPGVTACPRCAAIHASEDRFCPNCGLPMGRHADLPIAGPPEPANRPTAPSETSFAHAPEPVRSAEAQTASHVPAPARPSSVEEPTEILRPPLNGQ
jgi:hypothetical protein